MFNLARTAYLLLQDGSYYEGYTFGTGGTVIGEIVFTTGCTGYQETLTSPSFYGQLVTQTFPLIGNYGVNFEDFESDKVQAKGYIVSQWCEFPSNFRSTGTLDEFLRKQNVVGIHSIDTRSVTKKIREFGVMNGAITNKDIHDENIKSQLLQEIKDYKVIEAVDNVTCKEVEIYGGGRKYTVVLIDYGYNHSIRRELEDRGCKVIVVPSDTPAETILEYMPNGIMLSNGPGNPEDNPTSVKILKELCKTNIPIFGVDMGHQLLCLASGGKIEKLKCGHRGGNQPVIDLKTGKIYVTSQNHRYFTAKIPDSEGIISYVNANDKTCEGIEYKNYNAFSVQFFPGSDTKFLFDKFISKFA